MVFFSESVSAAARKLGSSLLTRSMARRHELRFQSYDRLFPSQDTVPKGGFGNLIALPFQGQEQKPWPVKQREKSLTSADFQIQARLMISDLIYADKSGFSQRALNTVKRLAAFRNPEFYKSKPCVCVFITRPGFLIAAGRMKTFREYPVAVWMR